MPDDWRDLPVHPFAASFPMLSTDEAIALALDITQNGLRYPIVLDHAGEVLLDGRNRLHACVTSGVEPRFERLAEGADPVAFILSANIERRHLTKGQQAVALARAYPEATGRLLSRQARLNHQQIAEAREILRHADLADQVMSGAMAFDRALNEARWRKHNAHRASQLMDELKYDAEDLAEEVTEGRASLYEAAMLYRRRQAEAQVDRRRLRESVLAGLQSVVGGLSRLRDDEAFRAGLIDRLKIEPSALAEALGDLNRFVSKTGE